MEDQPTFKFAESAPTRSLYIKTPNGVLLCGECHEYGVAEFWVMGPDFLVEKKLGSKCLWCGARNQ